MIKKFCETETGDEHHIGDREETFEDHDETSEEENYTP